MLKFVDKQPSLIFNRKRLFHATNRINDQIVVLGADVDANAAPAMAIDKTNFLLFLRAASKPLLRSPS